MRERIIYKKKFDEKSDDNKIESYNIKFSVKNGKVYVDEDVKAIDSSTKAEFLKRVSSSTDDIIDLIESFNS